MRSKARALLLRKRKITMIKRLLAVLAALQVFAAGLAFADHELAMAAEPVYCVGPGGDLNSCADAVRALPPGGPGGVIEILPGTGDPRRPLTPVHIVGGEDGQAVALPSWWPAMAFELPPDDGDPDTPPADGGDPHLTANPT